jgi:hypothetical protein
VHAFYSIVLSPHSEDGKHVRMFHQLRCCPSQRPDNRLSRTFRVAAFYTLSRISAFEDLAAAISIKVELLR